MDIEPFFASLAPISDWMEIGSPMAYTDIPSDWCILMTDIKGSTKAVQEGKYKQINMLGVCAIISVQNALKSDQFPFVFGGDGATILLPESQKERALAALSYTRKMAKEQFGFELRVFSMSLKNIRDAGKNISVARLENKNNQNIFLFRGGGITYAEELMKTNKSFELPEDHKSDGTHEGLECRWNSIPTQKGSIISLIIKPVTESNVIEAILFSLQEILISGKPIRATTIPVKWPPQDLGDEVKARSKSFVSYFLVLLLTAIFWPLIKLGRKKPDSAVSRYLNELEENNDFLKRDDSLKIVLDVSAEDKAEILKCLDKFKQRGLIEYGFHESPSALMTCMVRSQKNHFHFVDGSDGGYVKAADMLKKKLKAVKAVS